MQEKFPNKETIEAIKDVKNNRNLSKSYNSIKKLQEELEKEWEKEENE